MIFAIRVVHTAIYAVMAASIVYVLYAGIGGHFSPSLLYVALALVGLECIVFVGSGWNCPLTTVAVAVVGRTREDYAPLVPRILGKYTPALFGSLFGLGIVLLMVRLLLG